MATESLVEPTPNQLQLPPRQVGITRGHDDGTTSTIWFPIVWQGDRAPRPMIPSPEECQDNTSQQSTQLGILAVGQMEIPLPPRRLEPFEAGTELFVPDSWDRFGSNPSPVTSLTRRVVD